MKNIVLTGMPAAGKSTLGVVLAKAMDMNFIDTDLVIQQTAKRKLQDIIDKEGHDAFIALENDVICTLECTNSVISTGGSVVMEPDAMAKLKKNGVVVYLDCSYETISARLNNIKTRGIAFAWGQTLRDVYNARRPLYEKYADITVCCDGLDFEKTIENLIEKLNKTGTEFGN